MAQKQGGVLHIHKVGQQMQFARHDGHMIEDREFGLKSRVYIRVDMEVRHAV